MNVATKVINAVKYRNLDEARAVLARVAGPEATGIFDDNGEEPQGLLAVIPEDRVPDEIFVKLFNEKTGASVRVERIEYSGYGPPADETDYMGFATQRTAYVLEGCRLPIEITSCPLGAVDIHHLEAMVLDGMHPLERDILAKKLALPPDWDFEVLFDMLARGAATADEIDQLIHKSVH